MAAEIFVSIDGFDIGITIAYTLGEIFDYKVKLSMYTDSRSIYRLCISLAHTTERRLRIHLSVVREAHESRGISEII